MSFLVGGAGLLRPIATVARFELAEALRSRAILVLLMLYGVGSAVGCHLLLQLLEQGEDAAAAAGQSIPDDWVRNSVLPSMIRAVVDDPELASELTFVDPVALFYAFGAFAFAPWLCLFSSAGAVAVDLESGAARFILTRCGRAHWGVGKLLGHGVLLAVGIGGGAMVAAGVASLGGYFEADSALWLARASLRAWLYSAVHLCFFIAVSLNVRTATRARLGSLLLLVVGWISHSLIASLAEGREFLAPLLWLFPEEHRLGLWSPTWTGSLSASFSLAALGALALAAGLWGFARRDA